MADDEDDELKFDFSSGSPMSAPTKLDLARAYIDMGDQEGCPRDILSEVLDEGNESAEQACSRNEWGQLD